MQTRHRGATLSLRARLALALALAAALPLLIVVAIITQREEQAVRAEALASSANQAAALARAVDDYVGLHRAAVAAVAAQPGLLQQPPSTQRAELRVFNREYPDLLALVLYDAQGSQLQRSDDTVTAVPARGYPVYELARQNLGPSLDILISPVFHRPVLAFGAPIFDENGQFAGLVAASLASTRMAAFLAEQSVAGSNRVYLVDDQGRAIAHPDEKSVEELSNLSAEPPVAALLGSENASGSLTYGAGEQEQLAGYARVPGVNWGVVVERQAADALAPLRGAQRSAYGILLVCLAITSIAGLLLAGMITAPMRNLLAAVRSLADGVPPGSSPGPDLAQPGADRPGTPASQVTARNRLARIQPFQVPEVLEVTSAFGVMSERLAQRTAERAAEMHVRIEAEESLRQALAALSEREAALERANEDLEAQVAARVQDLHLTNDQLRTELAERKRAEAALRESEERYRSLVEWAPVAIMVHDGFTVLYVNPAGAQLLGHGAPDELIGLPILDLVHPDFRASVERRARQVVESGLANLPEEQKMLCLDGSAVDVIGASVPADFLGRPAVQTVILDMTERKRAEAEREAVLARLEQLVLERTAELRESADGLAKANEQLRILYEIDQAILAAHSPQEIAEVALARIRDILPYDAASIFMLQPESSRVEVLASAGLQVAGVLPGSAFALSDWEVPPELYHGEARRSADLTAEGDPEPVRRAWYAAGLRSRIQAPLVVTGNLVGTLNLMTSDPARLPAGAEHVAGQVAFSLAVAIQNARLDEQVRLSRFQLQALNRRLVEVQEDERRAIARELHDEAGQALATLMIGLGLIEREAGRPDAVLTRVAELKRTTDTVLGDLHDLAVDLRPASLDRLGLLPALQQYVETFRRQSGVEAVLEGVGIEPGERFPPTIETTAYRIVQEALTNIARHAAASYVGVLIERHADRLVVIVEDNGVGFDVDAALRGGRLGLIGMRERVEMVGGSLTIESSEGAGTTLYVDILL